MLVDLVTRTTWAVAHEATRVRQVEIMQGGFAALVVVGSKVTVAIVTRKVAVVVTIAKLCILHCERMPTCC